MSEVYTMTVLSLNKYINCTGNAGFFRVKVVPNPIGKTILSGNKPWYDSNIKNTKVGNHNMALLEARI